MNSERAFDVVVLGSANLDLVLPVAALPRGGETVLARDEARNAGGKGLNQAVASARAGACTAFVGAVGDDEPAAQLRSVLADDDIDTSRLRTSSSSTGLAVVAVDDLGENLIIVVSGANAEVRELDAADIDLIAAARILVLQLEIPLETVIAGARAAGVAGVTVVLNAAPAQPLPAELLQSVDLLVVNEHEARTLVQGLPVGAREDTTIEECAEALLDLVDQVVVTLGGAGALVAVRDEPARRQPAVAARVVDTTGAGDTFTGALAAALARGEALGEAVAFATAAASLSVESAGAVPAIPRREAIRGRQSAGPDDGTEAGFDPLAPRPIDLPTEVPLDPGADLGVLDEAKIIAAPADRASWPGWREQLHAWRSSARERFAYDDTCYTDTRTAWAARAWNVAMVWLWDEALYDWDAGRFDVDRLIATYADFGGLDAVVLWHAYPVIGIDDRNQFDYYHAVPDLAVLVESLQARGIRVFLDYNPWDVGTRRPARPDAEEVAALVAGTGADGVFLDTLKEGDATLRDTLLAIDPVPVLEGESRVPTDRIGDHLASWAQWMADSDVQGVLRARWFEQRHMLHHTRRWNTDHSDELQSAWVNGVGVLIWDVVFGSWVGWSDRDKWTMRAMRRVHQELGDHLLHGDWTPLPQELALEATDAGVFGGSYAFGGSTLWTLVNRRDAAYDGPVLLPADSTDDWYDLTTGARLAPAPDCSVATSVPARSVGAVLHVPAGSAPPTALDQLLIAAAADPPVSNAVVQPFDGDLIEVARAPGQPAAGAVLVPGGDHTVEHRRRVRETGALHAPAYRPGTWKPLPPHLHGITTGTRSVTLGGVAVDHSEVSNAAFAAFLEASGYRPVVPNRFLAHWSDGHPTPGSEGGAVTFVDLDDARAYARWRGARLPTDIEWQLASAMSGWQRRMPLVWNWTESEHRDGRTRWAFPKGGGSYAAQGSDWYVEGGPQDADWMLRLLLLGGGLSRSATIGFRCAVDLAAASDPEGGAPA